MLAPLLQPDLSAQYLTALAWPVAETLLLTLAAMAVALPLGILLGLLAASSGKTGKILARAFTIFRAIPELTLAIFCVIFFGLGPAAGLIAITLFYIASSARVFSELFSASQNAPAVTALKRTGAGTLSTAFWGLIPETAKQMLAYGSFAFECALRASVVVGAVGAGGLGGELVSTIASFDLHRASSVIIVTILMIVMLEQFSRWIFERPRLLWWPLLIGLAYAICLGPTLISPRHSLGVLTEMLPPSLSSEDWRALPSLLVETLFMALGATIFAALLALPIAFAASRMAAPKWLYAPVRIASAITRAVPEIIWGLILILFIGIGPMAGLAALFLHSLGSLIRLFADSLDAISDGPRKQIARSGASPIVASLFAALPQAFPAITTHTLFRFEWNLRMATVMGIIGAGGIGQALYENQQLLFYDRMAGWLLVTVLLLLVMEWLSGKLHHR